jgi:hypothetical protein
VEQYATIINDKRIGLMKVFTIMGLHKYKIWSSCYTTCKSLCLLNVSLMKGIRCQRCFKSLLFVLILIVTL